MNQNTRETIPPLYARKREVKSRDMTTLSHTIDNLYQHPRLIFLFLELTDACNLRCIHCGSRCGDHVGTFLDTGRLLQALDTVAEDFPRESVMLCITGGEPLLHPDFFEIVQHANRLGFPWGITTNGTLIDKPMAEALRDAKMDTVTVSLDGLETSHEWLRSVPGSFQKALAGITSLRDAGSRYRLPPWCTNGISMNWRRCILWSAVLV